MYLTLTVLSLGRYRPSTQNARQKPLIESSSTINNMHTQQQIEAAQQRKREAAASMAIAMGWDNQEQQHVTHQQNYKPNDDGIGPPNL